MLHNNISTLDTTLEIAEDVISYNFVEGFNGVIDQFKVLQPDMDTSTLYPFKSVVDGKIVDDEE